MNDGTVDFWLFWAAVQDEGFELYYSGKEGLDRINSIHSGHQKHCQHDARQPKPNWVLLRLQLPNKRDHAFDQEEVELQWECPSWIQDIRLMREFVLNNISNPVLFENSKAGLMLAAPLKTGTSMCLWSPIGQYCYLLWSRREPWYLCRTLGISIVAFERPHGWTQRVIGLYPKRNLLSPDGVNVA